MKTELPDNRVSERSAKWLGLLTESAEQRAAFFDWLGESPQHVEEFLFQLISAQEIAELTPEQCASIEKMAAQAPVARDKPSNVIRLLGYGAPKSGSAERWSRVFRSGWIPKAGWAFALSLILAGGWWLASLPSRQIYTTATGEQRTFELPDHSLVQLNTQSRLEVSFTRRSRTLRLLQGEALFKVQHETRRPFQVDSGDALIQAIGTQFDVYRRPSGTRVAVLEGLVRVSQAPSAASQSTTAVANGAAAEDDSQRLAAGERADVGAGGILTNREHVDPASAAAWRQRRLVFHHETLQDIAAEFNRYNRSPRIRIIGDFLAEQHFSGTFDADSPETLAQALAGDNSVLVEHRGNEILIRSRE